MLETRQTSLQLIGNIIITCYEEVSDFLVQMYECTGGLLR